MNIRGLEEQKSSIKSAGPIDIEVPDDRPQIETNPSLESDSNLDKIGKSIKQLKYGELSA